jgi:molecular chaperone GrpE
MTEQINQQAEQADQEAIDPRAQNEATASAGGAEAIAEPGVDSSAIEEPVPEIEALRRELTEAREEAATNKHKFLRAHADMENFKKRIERTYADLAKSSKKDVLKKLLTVKDNLERALQYGESGEPNGEGLMEGVRLTAYQLDQLLQQEGVHRIEAEGKTFDPRTEEALQTVNDLNVPDHSVVQVVRPGYTYQDEVLRPAQVIVSVHDEDK